MAAQSIALRNAIFTCVPYALIEPLKATLEAGKDSEVVEYALSRSLSPTAPPAECHLIDDTWRRRPGP